MKLYERIEADGFESQSERYRKIDELNKLSFLMTEGSLLQVIQSLHSIGASREVLTAERRDERKIIAGNMSPFNSYGPSELSREERIEDAKNNLKKFFHHNDIDQTDVRMLRPERDYSTPLTILNLDETPLSEDKAGLLWPDTAGDMMYTFDLKTVMAACPADCPIVFITAETPKGPILVLLHLATLGVAHGYIAQAKEKLDSLGVDWKSARVQVTPGGHGETYRYKKFAQYDPRIKFPESKSLFVDVEETVDENGTTAFNYGVDLAAEAYEKIVEQWGIDTYQIFLDTTDTTSPKSGYSSNSRAFQGHEVDGDNTRDIVLAKKSP
jgi:copper oxidase (laccase) domain-containing protein